MIWFIVDLILQSCESPEGEPVDDSSGGGGGRSVHGDGGGGEEKMDMELEKELCMLWDASMNHVGSF